MSKFKFSVGPWNVHAGADSYGPATRSEISLEEKFKRFAEIGFDAVQFHDDDAVPNINDLTEEEIKAEARRVKGLGGALSMQYLTLLMCLFGPVFFGHGRYGWPLLFCWPVLLAAAIFAARRNGGRA